MLWTRSSSTSNSGLSPAETITLYVVAGVSAALIILAILICILRSKHQKACRQGYARALSILKDMPIVQFDSSPISNVNHDSKTRSNSTCPICTEDFVQNALLHVLPCHHQYHVGCIRDWFVRGSNCPIWYVLTVLLCLEE